MKKTLIALALAGLSLPTIAQQKAPEPDISISGNFGLFSDYRFRGISQTQQGAALQGGFDLTHKNGLYAGTWASNVTSQYIYLRGAGSEVDVYGGYRWTFSGFGLDLGALRYIYPEAETLLTGAGEPQNYDTTEVYLGISYGPVSLKMSKATTDMFGTDKTKGSTYFDFNFSHGLTEKVTLGLHAGLMDDERSTAWSGTKKYDGWDYKASLAVALGNDYTLSAAYVWNEGDLRDSYKSGKASYDNKDLAEPGYVLSITKTF